jgi:hypothetical protein
MNRKYENQSFERADRRDREKENKLKTDKKRQAARQNAPADFSLVDEFPSLPGATKPVSTKPAEDCQGLEEVDAADSTTVEG